MKRRDFLLASGASIAAVAAGGSTCSKQPRMRMNMPPLRSLMAARVAEKQFPGAVWLVAHGDNAVSRAPGRYGWDGGFGTSWFNDPGRDLIAIVMTQSPDFLFSGGRDTFFRGVYDALA